MKSTRNIPGGLSLITSLVVGLHFLHAQTAVVGGFNGDAAPVQLAQPDSIVQIAAEAQGLELVPPDQVPPFGTFWMVLPEADGGVMPPFPCAPLDLSLPVFAIADGQFLVDGTVGSQATLNTAQAGRLAAGGASAAALAAQADAVINLITEVQTAAASQQMRAMSSSPPSPPGEGEEGGEGNYTNNYFGYAFDTNRLYLEITNVSGGWSYLNLHHATNQVYAIWGATNVATPFTNWTVETELWPTPDQTNVMPFTVPTLDRQNLFVRVEDWTGVDSDGDGIPDWWEWQYFGTQSVAGTNLDYSGNGYTFAEDYSNNIPPTVFKFTGVEVTNNYVRASSAAAQLDVAGYPYYVATLVDDANFSNAVWNTYASANVTVNLGLTEGWHEVWIGLRGHADDASTAVWQWRRLKLDLTPPLLVISSPASNVISQPMIQLKGYSPEPLASFSFDVANAAGTLTNQTGLTVDQFYDRSALDFTTNWFECLDIALAPGTNYVTLHATDRAGNATQTNLVYTFDTNGDTVAPVVTLTWPQHGMNLSGDSFTLRGALDDETATVTAQIISADGLTNIVAGLVERDGKFWIENLPLAGGTNLVMVTARDAAENLSATNIAVVQSSVTLTINPLADEQLHQLTATVTGTVTGSVDSVWVNGVPAVVDENGNWTADNVPLNPGGTASFNAVGQRSPPADPVQTELDQDKPPQVYVQHYDLAPYHSKVDSFNFLKLVPIVEDFQMQWTRLGGGDADYDFVMVVGWPTNVFPGSTETTWPVDAWLPTLDGTEIESGLYAGTNSVGPPSIPMEQCDIKGTGYFYNIADEKIETAQYNRTAHTVVRLFTGGKNVAGQMNLHALSVSLSRQAFTWWFGGGSSADVVDIAPGASAGVFGQVGSDDMAYQALADGRAVVITPIQSGVAHQGGDLPTGTKYKLVSETDCSTPTNRDRTTIGIGESVYCSTQPGLSVNWSVEGGGHFSGSTNGPGIYFIASKSPSTSIVHAKKGTTADLSITFNVIPPSSIKIISNWDVSLGTENPSGIKMAARTDYQFVIGPTNVSFVGIEFRENLPVLDWTWPNGSSGHYSATTKQIPTPPYCDNIVNDNIEEPMRDTSLLFNGTNYVNFSYTYTWTNQYKNESATWVDFKVMSTTTEYRGSDKKCRETYLGVPGGWQGPWQ